MRYAQLTIAASCTLSSVCQAQKGQFPPGFPLKPILPSSINAAPSVVPNVLDSSAPNAQALCPGYTASNVQKSSSGIVADLTLAGNPCNVYGTDIQDLILKVEYQSAARLAVKIYPKYIGSSNASHYLLASDLAPTPTLTESSDSSGDLRFDYSNSPSFQFKVSRKSSGEVIFDTLGTVIVFENQFLELKTSMVSNYNIYGLGEGTRSFRLPNTYTQTFWNNYNLTNDQLLDVNTHSTHPMYLETRYNTGNSTSHGVFARNAHGQDWVLKPDSLTYRTIGGSLELYFFSGPTAKDVISQYQAGVIGTPYIPAYWHLGFMQCRWGYQNWTNLQDVVDLYAKAGVQLEAIMSDLDYLYLNRMFTSSERYPADEGQRFLAKLHANGQYWLPILDPHVYVPNGNSTDLYQPYDQGNSMGAYLQNGNLGNYHGVMWSGFNTIPDFHPRVPSAQQFWTQQITEFHDQLPFDGMWLDVSDPTSFCTGSCGTGLTQINPIHVPFALPGDSDTMNAVNYMYPPGFEVTNATEAKSASSALMSQSSAYPVMATPTPVLPRTTPTPGVRNIQYPPYAIYNHLGGGTLDVQIVSTNATSHTGELQYDLHNLYGYLSANATYHALLQIKQGQRPWFASRATFSGSGNFSGHWGGDTNSNWANMYFGISQALQMSIAGIPYFGVETCGFNGNTDLELCTRWQQLSAWYPFYRNHNNRNTIAQEVYRWATNIESTKIIMDIRYSLLPYTYTLFWHANQRGGTVLRALAWEFPNEQQLATVETQFMSGPALLVTPVLEPLVTTVKGVFPGIASGTKWYDWYTLQPISALPGENKTLDAALTHQNIHVRGGYIIPMQKAGNNTKMTRKSAWSLLIALDASGSASGDLYIDDGITLSPGETRNVEMSYGNGQLTTKVRGNYYDGLPLANVTIAGFQGQVSGISCTHGGQSQNATGGNVRYADGTLHVTGLEQSTSGGIWSADFVLNFNSSSGSASGSGVWSSWG